MVSGSDGVRPLGGAHRLSNDRTEQPAQTPPPEPSPRSTGRFDGLESARDISAGAASASPRARAVVSRGGVSEAVRTQRQFHEQIRDAGRASEVVPSLFTQREIPPEVVQSFADAYAFELEPRRGTRNRYPTLAEVAERSGLNTHLRFPYGVLNISLDFDDESNTYVKECSARLRNRSQFLVGHGNGAHQTGHQLPIDMANSGNVLARCKDIVRQVGLTQFVAHGARHGVNDEGMAEVFYGETESERRQWVAAANPFIDGLKDFAVMPVTTPPGRIIDDAWIDAQFAAGNPDMLFNLYYAGFAEIPSVREGGIGMPAKHGSRFNPHSTYGKLWATPPKRMHAEDNVPVPGLPPAREGGGTVKYVSVYEMGPNGTVIGEPLLRLELPRG